MKIKCFITKKVIKYKHQRNIFPIFKIVLLVSHQNRETILSFLL